MINVKSSIDLVSCSLNKSKKRRKNNFSFSEKWNKRSLKSPALTFRGGKIQKKKGNKFNSPRKNPKKSEKKVRKREIVYTEPSNNMLLKPKTNCFNSPPGNENLSFKSENYNNKNRHPHTHLSPAKYLKSHLRGSKNNKSNTNLARSTNVKSYDSENFPFYDQPKNKAFRSYNQSPCFPIDQKKTRRVNHIF